VTEKSLFYCVLLDFYSYFAYNFIAYRYTLALNPGKFIIRRKLCYGLSAERIKVGKILPNSKEIEKAV